MDTKEKEIQQSPKTQDPEKTKNSKTVKKKKELPSLKDIVINFDVSFD